MENIRGSRLEALDRDGSNLNNVPDHLELSGSSVDPGGDRERQGNHARH